MDPSKETPNTLRWTAVVKNGDKFELYIPKWRVPVPWPAQLVVIVDENIPVPQVALTSTSEIDPIKVVVKKVSEHGRTVRYQPLGKDKKKWEIGEPYIPKFILSPQFPDLVYLEIFWDDSIGTWE